MLWSITSIGLAWPHRGHPTLRCRKMTWSAIRPGGQSSMLKLRSRIFLETDSKWWNVECRRPQLDAMSNWAFSDILNVTCKYVAGLDADLELASWPPPRLPMKLLTRSCEGEVRLDDFGPNVGQSETESSKSHHRTFPSIFGLISQQTHFEFFDKLRLFLR